MKTTTAADIADAGAAIKFALDVLAPFEAIMFLRDWREGKNLEPWLEDLTAEEMTVAV